MKRRRFREGGQTVAFVVGMTLALLLLAGLGIDGGRILSARERALDDAQEAARAGAQHIDERALRASGTEVLDPVAAQRAAQEYLRIAGLTGDVRVTGADITVTVRETVGMQILTLGGLGSVAITEAGTAHATRGTVTGA